jgi:hypothetical protein
MAQLPKTSQQNYCSLEQCNAIFNVAQEEKAKYFLKK